MVQYLSPVEGHEPVADRPFSLFFFSFRQPLSDQDFPEYSVMMLCSRVSLIIVPFISSLAIFSFYFNDNLSHPLSATKSLRHSVSKASENTTVPVNSSLHDVRTLQVSMFFGEEDKDIYQRCLETHLEHGKR